MVYTGGMTFQPMLPKTQKLVHTVAFRLTDAEYLELFPFFEAFEGHASPAIRWLLSQEPVTAVMQAAVDASGA